MLDCSQLKDIKSLHMTDEMSWRIPDSSGFFLPPATSGVSLASGFRLRPEGCAPDGSSVTVAGLESPSPASASVSETCLLLQKREMGRVPVTRHANSWMSDAQDAVSN